MANPPLIEKPKSAAAVIATLTAVTSPVPKRRVSRSLIRLETIVPAAMVIDIAPAYDTGTFSSG